MLRQRWVCAVLFSGFGKGNPEEKPGIVALAIQQRGGNTKKTNQKEKQKKKNF